MSKILLILLISSQISQNWAKKFKTKMQDVLSYELHFISNKILIQEFSLDLDPDLYLFFNLS